MWQKTASSDVQRKDKRVHDDGMAGCSRLHRLLRQRRMRRMLDTSTAQIELHDTDTGVQQDKVVSTRIRMMMTGFVYDVYDCAREPDTTMAAVFVLRRVGNN